MERTPIGAQASALRKRIAEACRQPRFPINITEEPVGEALGKAEQMVDFRFPSLWLLDPYRPDQLPWAMVERIVQHSHPYLDKRGVEQVRRPELIITLMTHALQRNFDNAPDLVTTALGLEEATWRPLVEELRQAGLNVRQAFINIYAQRLQERYGHQPIVLEVHGVDGNIVYAVVFCTTHPAAQYMTLVNRMPRIVEWKEHVWRPEARRLAENKRIVRREGDQAKIQKGLFDKYD